MPTKHRAATAIRALLAYGAVASITLSACGGDDDEATDPASAEIIDVAAVATCLEAAGFVVASESEVEPARVLNDAAKASVGLRESLFLQGYADGRGTGAVSFYDSADEALQADEAGSAMRSDAVLAGHEGSVQWNYLATAGSDDGVADAVVGCVD